MACAASPSASRFLDWVDLVFQEAGHVIFGFFGEFIGILRGSLIYAAGLLLFAASIREDILSSREETSAEE